VIRLRRTDKQGVWQLVDRRKMHRRFLVGKPKERRPLERPETDLEERGF